jgi:hypothetical protein
VPHLVSARLGLVASDFDERRVPASLQELPSAHTVTLSHTDDPHVEAL